MSEQQIIENNIEVFARLVRPAIKYSREDLRPFFEIRLLTTALDQTNMPHISMWVPAVLVDETARLLSRMLNSQQTMGDEQEVWVMYNGKVKAAYLTGQRVKTHDFSNEIDNLCSELYLNSKIRCSETNEWV